MQKFPFYWSNKTVSLGLWLTISDKNVNALWLPSMVFTYGTFNLVTGNGSWYRRIPTRTRRHLRLLTTANSSFGFRGCLLEPTRKKPQLESIWHQVSTTLWMIWFRSDSSLGHVYYNHEQLWWGMISVQSSNIFDFLRFLFYLKIKDWNILFFI